MKNNLAIKGHRTQGREVIRILEILGGRNIKGYTGSDTNERYTINEDGDIIQAYDWNNFVTFTLEKFLEKFPYKIGDKVIVKGYKHVSEILSMRWCSERDDIVYSVSHGWFYTEELQPYKKRNYEKEI